MSKECVNAIMIGFFVIFAAIFNQSRRQMVDLFEKLRMEAGPLAKYSHLPDDYFFFPKLEGEIGPHMKFNGKDVLNWSLNNYLGLANHPEVRKADADAAAQYGMGLPMGARMMSGNSKNHLELEKQLAAQPMPASPILPPAAPVPPGARPSPLLPPQAAPSLPPNAVPHEFNGQTFYIMPLGKDGTR